MPKPSAPLFALLALLPAAPAAAGQTLPGGLARPGDVGTLTYTIVNPASFGEPFLSAGISVFSTVADVIAAESDLGPRDILDGGSYAFTVRYRIKANAPTGLGAIVVTPGFLRQNGKPLSRVTPTFSEAQGVVLLFIDALRPVVRLDGVLADPIAAGQRTADIRYGIAGTAADNVELASVKLFFVGGGNLDGLSEEAYDSLPALAVFPAAGTFAPGLQSFYFGFGNRPAGDYAIYAKDRAGNVSFFPIAVEVAVSLRPNDSFEGNCYDKVAIRGDGRGFVTLPSRLGGFGQSPITYFSPGAVSRQAGVSRSMDRVLATIVRGIHGELGGPEASFLGPVISNVGGSIELMASAVEPKNDYLALTAPVDFNWTPVSVGAIILGGSPRLRAVIHKSADGASAPTVFQLGASLEQHTLFVKNNGLTRNPTRSCAGVGANLRSLVETPDHRFLKFQWHNDADKTVLVCSETVALNPDASCPQRSALQEGSTVALHVEFSSPPVVAPSLTLDFDPDLPLAERAYARMYVERPWGLEDVTESIDPAAGTITGRAADSGTYSVLVPAFGDKLPPETRLSTAGPLDSTGLPIAGPNTALPLEATDQVQAGADAGGLLMTEYRVGEEPYRQASTSLGLGEGVHDVAFRSWDRASNLERTSTGQVHVDATAPTVALQLVPQFTNNPLPAFRAAFADSLAGLAVSSLAFTLGDTPLVQTVVTPSTSAWRPGPPLLTPVYLHSMVYADGRLYSLGGNGPDTNYRPDVHVSALGEDGTPLGWTPTTPLPVSYGVMGAAALGGRIYVVGNWPGSEKVRFSAIGAGGALGAWNLGAPLPDPLFSVQAVAVASVGPYLYALGGQSTDNLPRDKVYRSVVDAATGMPGAWQEVLPLPVKMTASAAAGWGGRIYVMSGTTPQGLTRRVWSAGVVEGGALDGWRPEPDLPVAVHSAKALAAAGRVYFLGGEAGGRSAAVYSAAVLASGVLDGWRDETPLHVPLAFHAAAASPNALYYSGGAPGGSGIADTRYRRLNQAAGAVYEAELTAFPSAALGEGSYQLLARGADRVANAASAPPASMTVDLTPPRLALRVAGRAPEALGPTYFSALAAGFAAAYSDPDGAAPSGIDPASVRLSLDGVPVGTAGPAEAVYVPAALSTGPHRLEARVADKAGNAVVAAADVVYDPVPPELALLAPAPGAVYGAGPVALEARLSDGISGLATGSFVLSVGATAYPAAAEMLLGGSPLAWERGPGLRTPVYLNSLVYDDGTLYSLGGNNPSSAFVPEVTYSRVGADGVPGPWRQTTPLLGDSGSMGAAVLGGRIYLVGNFPGSKRVLYAKTLAQGPQALESEWHVGPELPAALFLTQAVGITAVGPYLYVIGGQALGNAPQDKVYRSKVKPDDGSLLGWEPMLALPEAMTHAAATTLNGRIYVMGGTTDAQSATNPHVWSTAVNGDGSLVRWDSEPDLPTPVRGAQAVSAAGRVYLLAGHHDATGRVAKVWSAAPGTGTLLAGWRAETPLPEPIAFHGAAASPGVLYLAGGAPAGSGTDAVRFARLSGVNPAFSLTASAVGLGEGSHGARASGADLAGNTAFASVTFHVDLTAPETSLELLGDFRRVGATKYALPGLALRLSATDYPLGAGGAGVTASYLSTGAAPFALTGTYALEPGFYALTYASVDRVGNFESTRTAAVKVDAVPPGAPQNLAGAGTSSGTLSFTWAVRGDDGGAEAFADAEVRLDVRADPAGFSTATARVALSSGPLAAGAPLSFAVGGLASGTTYYAAAFARDAAGNWSAPSNTASARTFLVAVSQDAVASFASPVPAAVTVVSTAAEAQAYTVAITSQSLTPSGTVFYELTEGLTFSTAAPAVISFTFDPTLVDTASARIYTYNTASQQWTSTSVFNQTVVVLASGLYLISGEILHTSLYAMFVRDTLAPLTIFAPTGTRHVLEGRVFVAAPSSGTLAAEDQAPSGARPSGLAGTVYALDEGPEQAYGGPFALAEGRRRLRFRSTDAVGNAEEEKSAEVFVDASSPTLDVALDQPILPIPGGFATLSATAVLTLSALEPAVDGARAGLAEAYYVLDGATATLAVTPGDASAGAVIQLGTGLHTLVWRASDRVGHVSERRLRVAVGDAEPPALAFAFPRPAEPGLCRLAQGPVTVRGTVFDEHLTSWRLAQGAVSLGSGTANAAGVLGTWDAMGQSGPLALTLTAVDLVANEASLALDVQAGQPARTLALGGKQVLNKPRGVAAGPNRIYVADTNADVVRVFDAAGTALAVLGDKKGQARLNKPAGLALDAAGKILVADANNKRVVKLSPAGAFLAEYGKGILQRPMAVALSAGRIVIADAKAGQLVVFADGGALLSRVDLPPASGPDEDAEEPRPVALAADAAGNVWAADAKGGRVLRYTPDLILAQTIPGFERPEGVAVSPSGACLAVSDAKAARIRTFDAEFSAGLASFGLHGEIKPDKPLPAGFFLNKPAQLAFTAGGTLLVADRNNDLIQGFGLPGAPAVVAIGGRPGKGTRLASAEGGGETVASARVGRFEGGRVEHPDGAAVEIPAGALVEDLDVAVAQAPEAGDAHRAREAARGLAGLAAGSAAREFSPHGLSFREPAFLTLPYDPLLAAAPRELKVHYWNAERSVWEALASEVDESAHTVTARVAHFSIYQVLAPANAFGALADPETGFAFRAIYAFPNPAVGGQKPTVHVAVGKADKVTVRFYDIAGTPVHEATLDTPSVINDESGPHWAYEYAWQGHIPSGVYLYAVTAEKAGHAPIKRIGKLAVVR